MTIALDPEILHDPGQEAFVVRSATSTDLALVGQALAQYGQGRGRDGQVVHRDHEQRLSASLAYPVSAQVAGENTQLSLRFEGGAPDPPLVMPLRTAHSLQAQLDRRTE